MERPSKEVRLSSLTAVHTQEIRTGVQVPASVILTHDRKMRLTDFTGLTNSTRY
jgi:hypothetical protein